MSKGNLTVLEYVKTEHIKQFVIIGTDSNILKIFHYKWTGLSCTDLTTIYLTKIISNICTSYNINIQNVALQMSVNSCCIRSASSIQLIQSSRSHGPVTLIMSFPFTTNIAALNPLIALYLQTI